MPAKVWISFGTSLESPTISDALSTQDQYP